MSELLRVQAPLAIKVIVPSAWVIIWVCMAVMGEPPIAEARGFDLIAFGAITLGVILTFVTCFAPKTIFTETGFENRDLFWRTTHKKYKDIVNVPLTASYAVIPEFRDGSSVRVHTGAGNYGPVMRLMRKQGLIAKKSPTCTAYRWIDEP